MGMQFVTRLLSLLPSFRAIPMDSWDSEQLPCSCFHAMPGWELGLEASDAAGLEERGVQMALGSIHRAPTWPPCWGGVRRPSLQRQNPNSFPALTSIHCLEILSTAGVDLNSPGRKRWARVTLAKQVYTNILSGTTLQSLKGAPPSNANDAFQN